MCCATQKDPGREVGTLRYKKKLPHERHLTIDNDLCEF